jgi:integrative and conjugative element protein (TIGR02256 family)
MKNGVYFSTECINKISEECKNSPDTETGGILLGRKISSPSGEIYFIAKTSGPGANCHKGRAVFKPDIDHYNKLLVEYGKSHGFEYLGEWHKHPKGFETTSMTDLDQVIKIFREEDRNIMICPIIVEKNSVSSIERSSVEFGNFRMNIFYISAGMKKFQKAKGFFAHNNNAIYKKFRIK